MRKVEKLILKHLDNGTKFKRGNTVVTEDGRVYLHDNFIFEKRYPEEESLFTLAGWVTQTTTSRLNVLLPSEIWITIKDFSPYVNIRGSLLVPIDESKVYTAKEFLIKDWLC